MFIETELAPGRRVTQDELAKMLGVADLGALQGFLDGDDQYLRNRLKRVQKERGAGQFHSFYRYFLLRLFHEGLAQPPASRKAGLDALLGKVPYLNGGIFELHEQVADVDTHHVARA